jgi:hypothetical protein
MQKHDVRALQEASLNTVQLAPSAICHSLSPIHCKPTMAHQTKNTWTRPRVGPEPSLQEPFVDYADSDCQLPAFAARGKENVSPPEATAPPLDNEDDELEAFGKGRTQARDAMIQVEGIPRMFILVDFEKWGSPHCREMLKKRNDLMLKMQKKVKKVSFCEVNDIFCVSPIRYYEDTGIGNEPSRQIMCRSPKQAFGLRKKPALYNILDRKQDAVDVFWI